MKETVTGEQFDELANARVRKAAKKIAAERRATAEADEEFDTIWLRDFPLEAANNRRLGLVTKEDLATNQRCNEEQAEGILEEARFYAALGDRVEEGKTVEECLTGWESHPLEQRDEVLLFVGAGYPTSQEMRFPVFLCPDGNLRVPDVTCCDHPLDWMELADKSKKKP